METKQSWALVPPFIVFPLAVALAALLAGEPVVACAIIPMIGVYGLVALYVAGDRMVEPWEKKPRQRKAPKFLRMKPQATTRQMAEADAKFRRNWEKRDE